MSEDSIEGGKLRRVYAEIARLKQEIAFKQGNIRRIPNHVSRKEVYQRKSERLILNPRKNETNHMCRDFVANRVPVSSQKVLQEGFIVDNKRRTLMTPRAMQSLHDQLKRRQGQHAQIRAQFEEEAWDTFKFKNITDADNCDRVKIEGDIFAVKSDGLKLLPISGKKRKEGTIVIWNSWTYLTCKSGILCRTFGEPTTEYCRFFTRLGACGRGSKCFFVHDMSHMAICRHFLAGRCDGKCLHSHETNEFNTPICRYHFEDRCSNANCKYSHNIPPFSRDDTVSLWTCRPFAMGGWCERGSLCPFAHLFNCPEYEETGHCPWGKSCNNTHTVTRRVQQLIADPLDIKDVYVASGVSGEEDKTNVSSYTVAPELLFIRPDDKIQFSIDRSGEKMVIDLNSSDDERYDDTSSETDLDQVHFEFQGVST